MYLNQPPEEDLALSGGFRVRAFRPPQPVPPIPINPVLERGLRLLLDARTVTPIISLWPRVRLYCLLRKMRRYGSQVDDRFVTWRMVRDDFGTGVPSPIQWKRARNYLTHPPFFGSNKSDQEFLENLRKLDEMIYLGRWFLNNLYAQQSRALVSRGHQWLRDWIAAREKDERSIYRCHRG